jgi:protein O-mannosyl-transferase
MIHSESELQIRGSMIFCLGLACMTLVVFWQVGSHQFINYDDPLYVTNNAHVKAGVTARTIAWAFATTAASNWHPLTWLSHMADVEIFGLNPRWHHLMSVLIHAASTVLLFLLLLKITASPWQCSFAAALFAIHPLHVESVAWVAERKDVLSGFFWMLALLFYSGYAKKPDRIRYAVTLLSFATGLMVKPMLVSLPAVMLLMDYWPLDRFRSEALAPRHEGHSNVSNPLWRLLKEKIPFLFLSLVSGLVTIYAQRSGGTMSSLEVVPLVSRVGNTLIAYAKYTGKTIWPQNLAFFYPFPLSIPLWHVIISCALLILISLGTIRLRHRFPYLIVGWLWFLLTLLPVIGLVQVGAQSMADRYTYIPLVGLFIMISWGIPDLLRGLHRRTIILAISASIVITVLSGTTWKQLGYWKDDISLYRHTLGVTSNNYIILTNLGIALAERGDVNAAIQAYEEALRIWPRSATVHVNLGAALADQGKMEEAISHYGEALRLKPGYVLARINWSKALNNRGVAWAQQGKLSEAIGYFSEALRIDPDSVDGHFNLGITLARLNRIDEAEAQFLHVLRLAPGSAEARNWLKKLGR